MFDHAPWVPIWLLTRICLLVMPWHSWNKLDCSLEWWRRGGTDPAYALSVTLGFSFLNVVFVVTVLLGRWWFS